MDHSAIEKSDAVRLLVLADEYGLLRLVDFCELYISEEINKSTRKQLQQSDIDVIDLLLTAQVKFDNHSKQKSYLRCCI